MTKAFINTLLTRLTGYRLARLSEPLDLRERTDDAIEGFYLSGGKPFLFSAPLRHCRILHATALGCGTSDYNPLVQTCTELDADPRLTVERSSLKLFYDHWQPKHAGESLGLPAHPRLKNVPSYGYVYPWQSVSLRDKRGLIEKSIRGDSGEHGGADLSLQDGWKECGPLSEKALAFEFNRLRAVHESVKRNGFMLCRSGNNIRAVVLANKSSVRFLISPGHHRVATLAAHGFQVAPIWIGRRIVRDEVASWVQVRSGLFSVEDSLAVFDRIFEGFQGGHQLQQRLNGPK